MLGNEQAKLATLCAGGAGRAVGAGGQLREAAIAGHGEFAVAVSSGSCRN